MPVADQVKAIIVGHLGVGARELTPETLFRDDLGADSLDSFELLMAFEDEFEITVGHHLLEPTVLVLQLPQPLHIGRL